MSRRFIMTILAAAIAFSGVTAAPARAADSDAMLRALGIGTALLVVGAAIRNARADDDRKDRDKKAKPKHVAPSRHEPARRWQDDRGRRSWSRGPAPLPPACLIDRRRQGAVFDAQCLGNRYSESRRLPDNCRFRMDTRRGKVTVYDAGCLRRSGYELARR